MLVFRLLFSVLYCKEELCSLNKVAANRLTREAKVNGLGGVRDWESDSKHKT